MTTLVYLGGASLTFGSGTGRQIVKRGEPFEVGAELAKILLADPHVSPADAVGAPVPRGTAAPTGLDTFKAMRTRAKELGIPATGKAPALAKAIVAAEKRVAKSAGESNQGGNEPADDPAASATGEAGTPPPSDPPAELTVAGTKPSGAITLGDLPMSAIKGKG